MAQAPRRAVRASMIALERSIAAGHSFSTSPVSMQWQRYCAHCHVLQAKGTLWFFCVELQTCTELLYWPTEQVDSKTALFCLYISTIVTLLKFHIKGSAVFRIRSKLLAGQVVSCKGAACMILDQTLASVQEWIYDGKNWSNMFLHTWNLVAYVYTINIILWFATQVYPRLSAKKISYFFVHVTNGN